MWMIKYQRNLFCPRFAFCALHTVVDTHFDRQTFKPGLTTGSLVRSKHSPLTQALRPLTPQAPHRSLLIHQRSCLTPHLALPKHARLFHTCLRCSPHEKCPLPSPQCGPIPTRPSTSYSTQPPLQQRRQRAEPSPPLPQTSFTEPLPRPLQNLCC